MLEKPYFFICQNVSKFGKKCEKFLQFKRKFDFFNKMNFYLGQTESEETIFKNEKA